MFLFIAEQYSIGQINHNLLLETDSFHLVATVNGPHHIDNFAFRGFKYSSELRSKTTKQKITDRSNSLHVILSSVMKPHTPLCPAWDVNYLVQWIHAVSTLSVSHLVAVLAIRLITAVLQWSWVPYNPVQKPKAISQCLHPSSHFILSPHHYKKGANSVARHLKNTSILPIITMTSEWKGQQCFYPPGHRIGRADIIQALWVVAPAWLASALADTVERFLPVRELHLHRLFEHPRK